MRWRHCRAIQGQLAKDIVAYSENRRRKPPEELAASIVKLIVFAGLLRKKVGSLFF
jgi:hypothetical protein